MRTVLSVLLLASLSTTLLPFFLYCPTRWTLIFATTTMLSTTALAMQQPSFAAKSRPPSRRAAMSSVPASTTVEAPISRPDLPPSTTGAAALVTTTAHPTSSMVPASKSLRHKLGLPRVPPTPTLSASTTTTTTRPLPRIVGHRGSLYEALENTREAFGACVGTCQAVELDVFVLPRDGALVVFHGSGTDQQPGWLDEYCTNAHTLRNADGQPATSILDLTFQQTQQLSFNPRNPELAAPADRVLEGKIPTLEQVLRDLQPTGLEVKIELKGPGTARPVVELVDHLGMVEHVSFSSFNHDELQTVRDLRPQTRLQADGSRSFVYRTGALFDTVPDDFIQQAQKVQANEIHLRYDTCTKERVEAIHAAGLGSMVWMRGPVGMALDTLEKYWDMGNEDETCFATLVETGVQQLCVNKPRVLYDYLHRQQPPQRQYKSDTTTIAMTPGKFQEMATIPSPAARWWLHIITQEQQYK